MGKYDKFLLQILKGASDTNILFEDLCQLLRRMGFDERVRGSHHIFRKQGIEEKINLQCDDTQVLCGPMKPCWKQALHYSGGPASSRPKTSCCYPAAYLSRRVLRVLSILLRNRKPW